MVGYRCQKCDFDLCGNCEQIQTATAVSPLLQHKGMYCGRTIGRDRLAGSDGRCGPTNGPQCEDCKQVGLGRVCGKKRNGAAPRVATPAHGMGSYYNEIMKTT